MFNGYSNEWYRKSSFNINVLDMVGLVLLPVSMRLYTQHTSVIQTQSKDRE